MSASNRGKKPSKQACGLCGTDPATGFATVDGVRYCHGDFEPDPTCYMKASRGVPLLEGARRAWDVFADLGLKDERGL